MNLFQLLLVFVCILPSYASDLTLFDQWMKEYNKIYSSETEKLLRFKIFMQNVDLIEDLKCKDLTYSVALNQFSDLTFEVNPNWF